MNDKGINKAFELAYFRAQQYRNTVCPPKPSASLAQLREAFDVALPEQGRAPEEVIKALADAAEPGLMGNTSSQFYGWVMGASHPVGIAADYLTSTWGQNAGIFQTAPAAAVAEEVCAKWLLDLLDLPAESSVGFATGATMSSFTCLAAARSEVLRQRGWDLELDGFNGAPAIQVFLGEEAHSTIFAALRYLGFGDRQLKRIKSDEQGRISCNHLAQALSESSGPNIIIAQAGHINSGAFDSFSEISALAKTHQAWLHVDGAFGLWARSVPAYSSLCTGLELADSWSVDGHKWLQVPYDSGFAIVRNSEAHHRVMAITASYLGATEGGRNPSEWVPELSRRARGFVVWAVMQSLGRQGVVELVTRHCQCASHLAELLVKKSDGICILNEVVLNQLAISFGDKGAGETECDQYTQSVIEEIQAENIAFVSGARWKGRWIMRVSVIAESTGLADVERLAELIVGAWSNVSVNQCG